MKVPVRDTCIVFAALLMLAGCGDRNGDADGGEARPVRLHDLGAAEPVEAHHLVGRVDAVSTVDLSFQVGGKLTQLPVQHGHVVPAGELIAALDPEDFRLAVREAKLRKEQARRDLERNRPLLRQGTIPSAEMEQLETRYQLSHVALDTARRNLAHARITAPFDALITRRHVDAQTNVQPNTPIVRVQNVEGLRVHVNVPEYLMAALADPREMNAQAVFADRPESPIELSYHEHETEPAPVAQTYRVTFSMPRPERRTVLPGMTVTVRLLAAGTESNGEHHLVPVGGLDSDTEGAFRVWVRDPDTGRVTPRPVEVTGLVGDSHARVTGLEGNEVVVGSGVHMLREGMMVTPFQGF